MRWARIAPAAALLRPRFVKRSRATCRGRRPVLLAVAASLEGLPEDALAERPAVRQDGRALDPCSSIVRHLGALARQIEGAGLKLRPAG
jgi:hypothetical protein